jgi:hypothetical protein
MVAEKVSNDIKKYSGEIGKKKLGALWLKDESARPSRSFEVPGVKPATGFKTLLYLMHYSPGTRAISPTRFPFWRLTRSSFAGAQGGNAESVPTHPFEASDKGHAMNASVRWLLEDLTKCIFDQNRPKAFDSAESFVKHVRPRVAQFDLVALPLPLISGIVEDLLRYASGKNPVIYKGWLLATADFLQVIISELGGESCTSPIVTSFPKIGRSPWAIFRDELGAADDRHPVYAYLNKIFAEKRYVCETISSHSRSLRVPPFRSSAYPD